MSEINKKTMLTPIFQEFGKRLNDLVTNFSVSELTIADSDVKKDPIKFGGLIDIDTLIFNISHPRLQDVPSKSVYGDFVVGGVNLGFIMKIEGMTIISLTSPLSLEENELIKHNLNMRIVRLNLYRDSKEESDE